GQHGSRAVPPDIVEAAHRAVVLPHDQRALAVQRSGGEVPRLLPLADLADELPVIEDPTLPLLGEEAGVLIGPARQRLRREGFAGLRFVALVYKGSHDCTSSQSMVLITQRRRPARRRTCAGTRSPDSGGRLVWPRRA